MDIPPNVAALWNAYVKAVGGVSDTRFYEAFFFNSVWVRSQI
jgi:hypothetical protein